MNVLCVPVDTYKPASEPTAVLYVLTGEPVDPALFE